MYDFSSLRNKIRQFLKFLRNKFSLFSLFSSFLVAQKIKVKFSRIYFYPNDDEEKKEKKKRIVLLSRSCELSFGIIREGCGDKKREDSIRVQWVLLQDPLSRFKAARWKESAPAWMNPSTLVALEIGHRSIRVFVSIEQRFMESNLENRLFFSKRRIN